MATSDLSECILRPYTFISLAACACCAILDPITSLIPIYIQAIKFYYWLTTWGVGPKDVSDIGRARWGPVYHMATPTPHVLVYISVHIYKPCCHHHIQYCSKWVQNIDLTTLKLAHLSVLYRVYMHPVAIFFHPREVWLSQANCDISHVAWQIEYNTLSKGRKAMISIRLTYYSAWLTIPYCDVSCNMNSVYYLLLIYINIIVGFCYPFNTGQYYYIFHFFTDRDGGELLKFWFKADYCFLLDCFFFNWINYYCTWNMPLLSSYSTL